MTTSIQTWCYQHYKGKHCEVIGVAMHSETAEELIIYKNCEDSESSGTIQLRARPLSLFIETIEIDGQEIPRFKYIGQN